MKESKMQEDLQLTDSIIRKYFDTENTESYADRHYYYGERFINWIIKDDIFVEYAKSVKSNKEKELRLMYVLQLMLCIVRRGAIIIGYKLDDKEIDLLVHEETLYDSDIFGEDLFRECTRHIIKSILLKLCIESDLCKIRKNQILSIG